MQKGLGAFAAEVVQKFCNRISNFATSIATSMAKGI